jgi:membrane-bound lytic murein transglycosylase D
MNLSNGLKALGLAAFVMLAGCATPGSGDTPASAVSPWEAGVASPSKPSPASPDIMQPLAAAQASSQGVAMLRPPADLWERIRRGYAMPTCRATWCGTANSGMRRDPTTSCA